MPDENESNSDSAPGGIVKQTIDSATALAKAVPIYDDAVQPLAKETGKALGTVGRAVNVALAPLAGLVWGYDRIKDYIENRVAEKLEGVPEENVQTPNPSVAGPAIEALRFTGHDEDLRELFANLIATSIDKSTALNAHPAFVDIIKNLSSDEAKILGTLARKSDVPAVDVKLNMKKGKGFHVLHRHVTTLGRDAVCSHPELIVHYLDNLVRLGLLEIPNGRRKNGEAPYKEILNDSAIISLQEQFKNNEEMSISFDYMYFAVTDLGRQFIQAAVIDKAIRKPSAEQDGADQPATAPESKSEGKEKPKPESEGRPR